MQCEFRTVRRGAAAFLLVAATLPAQELTETTWERWRDYIVPRAEEQQWRAVPWRSELRRAVLEANRDRKPILLWAMNGHPLGCT